MSGVFLNEGIVESSLHEAVKLKAGFPWRTQDIRDARVMGYLPRIASNREWSQVKRKKHVAVKKTKQSLRCEEHFDIRHGAS